MKQKNGKKIQKSENVGHALKRWRFFAAVWPLMCVAFCGIIVCQPGRGGEERISDAIFAILPLVFFALGMRIRRRLIKECGYASALASAVVVSEGKRMNPAGKGKKDIFIPEFEFQANGNTYRVTAPSGSGFRLVKKGAKVDLYYTPENPSIFYVPAIQNHERRCSWLFCGIGVVFPLLGLSAPLLRALVLALP